MAAGLRRVAVQPPALAVNRRTVPTVWYASYGSNMDRERFLCYIAGGRPRGSLRTYEGCGDKTPPRGDRPIRIPRQIYFAGQSRTWGGGSAFVDIKKLPENGRPTLGRAYHVTAEQFEQVVAQENWQTTADFIDLRSAVAAGSVAVGDGSNDGRYQNVVVCGEIGGIPVVTCTSRSPIEAAVLSAPTSLYLAMIGEGLRASWKLTSDQIAAYLQACPGVNGAVSMTQLRDAAEERSASVLS